MADKELVFEDFRDKVGECFALPELRSSAMALTLKEAEPLPRGLPGRRPPFSLVFVGKHAVVLPQRLYQLEHTALGPVSIFLVPIGRNADGVCYQATFN